LFIDRLNRLKPLQGYPVRKSFNFSFRNHFYHILITKWVGGRESAVWIPRILTTVDTRTGFCWGDAKEKDPNGRPTSTRNLLNLRLPKVQKNSWLARKLQACNMWGFTLRMLGFQVFLDVALCNWASSSRRLEKSWYLNLQLLAEQEMLYSTHLYRKGYEYIQMN
jgi:hypothetical protein